MGSDNYCSPSFHLDEYKTSAIRGHLWSRWSGEYNSGGAAHKNKDIKDEIFQIFTTETAESTERTTFK